MLGRSGFHHRAIIAARSERFVQPPSRAENLIEMTPSSARWGKLSPYAASTFAGN
jgi:hypothetical protein